MGASSVTGVSGFGDSQGKYKPENNSGCGCGGTTTETPTVTVRKTVCSISYKTQATAYYRVSSGARNVKAC